MAILGIDEITYGADDLPKCRQFFQDWGLQLVDEAADRLVFETLNGCRVVVADARRADLPPAMESGPTLREVVWGVDGDGDLARIAQKIAGAPGFVEQGGRIGCTDPNGLAVRFQVTRKRAVQVKDAEFNTWNRKGRVNQAAPAYERATPIEVGHVVFFVKDVAACERFYVENFGFAASEASFAVSFRGATPTEQVRPCSSSTRRRISAAIVGPSPSNRCAPETSRKASSSEIPSTSGVTLRNTSNTAALSSW